MFPRGLLKEHSQMLSFIMRILDVLAVVAAGLAAYDYKFGHLALTQHYTAALLIAAGITFVVFPFFHVYESARSRGFWQPISHLIQAIVTVLLILAGLAFITKTGEWYSREWYLWWGAFVLTLLILFRCTLLILLHLMRAHGWNERRVIVIGAGELGVRLIENTQQALWTGFHIEALFDDAPENKVQQIAGIPVQKTPRNLGVYLDSLSVDVDEIWFALPLNAESRVKELMHDLRHHTVAIRFVLDIFAFDLINHSITDLAGFPALNLNSTPMIGMNRMIKAIEDRVLAAIILLLISPLLFIIAIGVKCSSKGPIFFKQKRHGWDGRINNVYKFRTMYVHQENTGQVTQATQQDSRVTPFGKILRRTSLDELPQFYNVLQGRMSIVGPRPHAVAHNEYYKDSIKAYMQRHQVKPGITGWAQVNGWRGETETLEKMQKRIDYDLYYIQNWSLWFDLKIIFLTLFQGFFHKNAY